jgi:RecJ-like exonuclease
MYTLKKIETCSECNGTGRIYAPFCRECNRRYTSDDLIAAQDANVMPCGHTWRYLEEEPTCSECEGAGEIISEASLEEALRGLDVAVMIHEDPALPEYEHFKRIFG